MHRCRNAKEMRIIYFLFLQVALCIRDVNIRPAFVIISYLRLMKRVKISSTSRAFVLPRCRQIR